MTVIIDMPKLSDTMTTGTLVNWLKNEGDPVAPGDMIAEIETDKATMELENFEDGILLKQYVAVGDSVAIGAPIAAIGQKGEKVPDVPSSPPPSTAKEVKKEVTKEPKGEEMPPPPLLQEGGRIKASPLAKSIAVDKNISLETLTGTGPEGRIVKADVLAALEKGQKKQVPQHPIVAMSLESNKIAKDEVVPLNNMRRAVAAHLSQSKSQIPHFYLDIEVDVTALIELRINLNTNLSELPAEKGGIKFTINDFILRATAEALRRVPAVNASWQGESIRYFGSIHLAFGVAVDDGLVTPVIRDVQAKGLRQISLEAKELVNKARHTKLSPNDITGHTFTVTNLGMYSINHFFGIINPPNAGILSAGATIQKPVVSKDGKISIGHRMNLGFSGDHRVIDGATGAHFLLALKEILETPALMLV